MAIILSNDCLLSLSYWQPADKKSVRKQLLPGYVGTTAVVSISTLAVLSISAETSMTAIAG